MECFAKIVKGCNYFRDISFSRFLLYEIIIMKFLNTGLIFTPEVLTLCKKGWGPRGPRAMDFDIPLTITAFHWSKRMEQPFGSLSIGIKNFIEYIWIFVSFSIFYFFCWNFPATFENIWSRVLFKYTCRPSWKFSTKLLRAGILQSESASVCFCKKRSSQQTLSQKFFWISKMRKGGICSFWHAFH